MHTYTPCILAWAAHLHTLYPCMGSTPTHPVSLHGQHTYTCRQHIYPAHMHGQLIHMLQPACMVSTYARYSPRAWSSTRYSLHVWSAHPHATACMHGQLIRTLQPACMVIHTLQPACMVSTSARYSPHAWSAHPHATARKAIHGFIHPWQRQQQQQQQGHGVIWCGVV